MSVDNRSQPQTYLAELKATEAHLDGDTWAIDQEGTLTNVIDGCE